MTASAPFNSRRLLAAVRNALMRLLGPDLVGRFWWRVRGRAHEHLIGGRRARFEYMYRTGHWIQGKQGPLSGWGSSLEATRSVRTELPLLLGELKARSLVDLGCGDFTWMSGVELPCPYIGVDIVPQLIADLERAFGNEQRKFLLLDACEEPLPQADVILCREVMFHLSFSDMEKMFTNVKASGARYFVATTNTSVDTNVDIPTGEHSDRNLALRPLNLGPPERTLWDAALAEGRVLGVWTLQ